MSIFDNFKNKKEEIVEKAKQLKNEHDARQREKKEDWLFQKEVELKELEETLKNREKIIRQKEIKLTQKFFLRSILLIGSFLTIGLFVLVSLADLNRNTSGEKNLTNESRAKESRTSIDPNMKPSEYPLSIPSDSEAKYYVLKKEGTNDMPILVTKRVGSSGTDYSKRIFDCQNETTKYLGNGATIDEMNNSSPNFQMGSIYPQSIAWYQWNHVCNN